MPRPGDGAPSAASATGPGALLALIREGRAQTRADLVRLTGLARSTVAQRVEALVAQGLVRSLGDAASTGGRPPQAFAFNAEEGTICVADLGATHSRLALTDLAGTVLVARSEPAAIASGAEPFLLWLGERFDELLAASDRTRASIRGIGVGLPGPVEFATGRPVKPPIMPGWDGFPVAEWLAEAFGGVPVLVDNDVNLMALGEHARREPPEDELLFVKVGTGIGCGIVSGGRIHRGRHGAAGDIGHLRVAGHDDVRCACGNSGCLEAVAGGRAMAAELRRRGLPAERSADVVALARAGEPAAVELVREAGRLLGEVLAAAVNLLNPGAIVIGGDLAEADDQLLAGVRERVYERSTPLATRHVRIARSALGADAGIVGAAAMVLDSVLAPAAVDAAIASTGAVSAA